MYCNMWTKDGILGQVHDITYRDIYIITDDGMPMPACGFSGANEEHMVQNVTIDGLYWNGEKVTPAVNANPFARNIECR